MAARRRRPYPAVVDGRVVWILDGYTHSDTYPYSQRIDAGGGDQPTRARLVRHESWPRPQEQVNYVRNSVKATVDAYDGTVTLYAWDEEDPVLADVAQGVPGTVQPRDEIPDELLEHLRYPEDLFKVQRALLAEYHVTDPRPVLRRPGLLGGSPDRPDVQHRRPTSRRTT